MLTITDGQCGKCAHFGENAGDEDKLVQIRISGQAPENFQEPCGHPTLKPLNLTVTATSGCAGFTPAMAG
ncbi:MAG: hypothetical protein AAFX79_07625 [Planctomycetota bacterium]